jgi:cell filamentation protein
MNRYEYEFERANAYCYPNSSVLRNKLDIQDGDVLNAFEREITSTRIQQALDYPIKGRFDLKHLCDIHRFVFSDVYEWAGDLRTVNIAKGNQFCNYVHLDTYADGIFSKLKMEKMLMGATIDAIPERLAYYLSEINVVHPFREGNGRTQRVFIEYLAQSAGFDVTFEDVSSHEMIEASALAFAMEYDMMITMLKRITTLITPQEQQEFREKIGLARSRK